MGVGYSSLSLLENGHKVISIDENPLCLKKAKLFLENKGFSVKYFKRERIQNLDNGNYISNYDSLSLSISDSDILLIESDIAFDPGLIKYFQKFSLIDGIICWNIGVNGAKYFHDSIRKMQGGLESPAEYREFVHNFLYNTSTSLLKNNGILHLVDRGKISLDQNFDLVKDHSKLNYLLEMEMINLDYKILLEDDIHVESGNKMIYDENTAMQFKSQSLKFAFISWLFKRKC